MKKMITAVALAMVTFLGLSASAEVVEATVVSPQEFTLERGETVWGDWLATSRSDWSDWSAYRQAFAVVNQMPATKQAFQTMAPGVYLRPIAEVVNMPTTLSVADEIEPLALPGGVADDFSIATAIEILEALPTNLRQEILAGEIDPLKERVKVLESGTIIAGLTSEEIAILADAAQKLKETAESLKAENAALIESGEKKNEQIAALLASIDGLDLTALSSVVAASDDGSWLGWLPWLLLLLLVLVCLFLAWALIPRRGIKRDDHDQVLRERDDFKQEVKDLDGDLAEKQNLLRERALEVEGLKKVIDDHLYTASDGQVYAFVPGKSDQVVSLNSKGNLREETIRRLEQRIAQGSEEPVEASV